MNASLEQTLYSAAVNTFEQMVYLLPDIPPDETQLQLPVKAVASVAFSGPAHGMLQIHAGEGLLPRLTANMLGADAPNEALQLDALGEIANIICGQVLPALDPVSAFKQQPPEVITGEGTAVAPAAVLSARAEVGLESSRADLMLFIFPESNWRSLP